jgi:hypothetical protein
LHVGSIPFERPNDLVLIWLLEHANAMRKNNPMFRALQAALNMGLIRFGGKLD